MLALALDHFFSDDLRSLEPELASRGITITHVPYQRIQAVARLCFKPSVFDDLSLCDRSMETVRARMFLRYSQRLANWLVYSYAPSIFIVPSDSIFYLRPLIRAMKVLGVSTVVVQKETTLSPAAMRDYSIEIEKFAPFIADHMTVCSDRQKLFWIKTGVPEELISLTGQPRFDRYFHVRNSLARQATEFSYDAVFLSFDDHAYLPESYLKSNPLGWREMRHEIEKALSSLGGELTLAVKNHPQQKAENQFLTDEISIISRAADFGSVVMSSDVFIGFQSTALLEALLTGCKVIYVAWGNLYENSREDLIPFENFGDNVICAQSGEHLRSILANLAKLSERSQDDSVLCEHLGPIDGRASSRTADVILKFALVGENHYLKNRRNVGSNARMFNALLSSTLQILIKLIQLTHPSSASRRKTLLLILKQINDERGLLRYHHS